MLLLLFIFIGRSMKKNYHPFSDRSKEKNLLRTEGHEDGGEV